MDRYETYDELKMQHMKGQDYDIHVSAKQRMIIAPHGGGIEPGTSELTRLLAERTGMGFYIFEGRQRSGNADMHITSTHFDEPTCVHVVGESTTTLAIHGYLGKPEQRETIIGGRDEQLKRETLCALQTAGFTARIAEQGTLFSGQSPRNIVNMNRCLKGVQLEISLAQRMMFFHNFTLPHRMESRTGECLSYVTALSEVYR
ncbi:poly-gamma-glutamate hydrolase family protein [Geomicrobium sp. JCM 19039]|uniref:poly-gamma-glutamate hydrolase family protein n=1 Tax=Geomicrobium sp. JCM 19039 TaxID=1460636 RepID=UPI00045F1C4F|nr:poly-gamma-glutamate hydrolase family protein [Geomicrobium sp. JCM 19039]GAK13596.1 phage-related protein [Geomicrobium sp. JCM 19039]